LRGLLHREVRGLSTARKTYVAGLT
jgi:hypothetical protein